MSEIILKMNLYNYSQITILDNEIIYCQTHGLCCLSFGIGGGQRPSQGHHRRGNEGGLGKNLPAQSCRRKASQNLRVPFPLTESRRYSKGISFPIEEAKKISFSIRKFSTQLLSFIA